MTATPLHLKVSAHLQAVPLESVRPVGNITLILKLVGSDGSAIDWVNPLGGALPNTPTITITDPDGNILVSNETMDTTISIPYAFYNYSPTSSPSYRVGTYLAEASCIYEDINDNPVTFSASIHFMIRRRH